MALRIINAPDGTQWSVWDVKPTLGGMPGNLARVRSELSGGWLAFQTASERRRIAPVPEGWEQLPDSELIALWEIAERVSDAGHRT